MKATMKERRRKKGRMAGPAARSLKGGFTLVEVMFASTISLLLFLTLLETLSVCQRMASNVKWRLSADAIAYDAAWRIFNEQTAWFEKRFNRAGDDFATWENVPKETSSVWYGDRRAALYWAVKPVGSPAKKWIISTNVQWPVPGADPVMLPKDYVIERCLSERNLFRGMN